MITAYMNKKRLVSYKLARKNLKLIEKALWLDLIHPSRQEKKLLEETFAIDIPTQEEMKSIELSSRLYKRNNTLFMTAMMIAHSTSPQPIHEPVTFIVTEEKLITIRYIEPQAFPLFVSQVADYELEHDDVNVLFTGLLEAIIDRLADHLELVGKELDDISQKIFGQGYLTKKAKKINYQTVVRKIGFYADLNNKARDSLVTFNRLVSFFSQSIEAEEGIEEEKKLRIDAITTDIEALSDYANFISTKVSFLLDATLGLISIDQSTIIKILSVAAVIFLPPTLIASIYGMNFKFMPELSWKWGYLLALILMFLSATFSYKFFRYKKWL